MSEATFTVTLRAAELNLIVASLIDVAEARKRPHADELLRDETADYSSAGELADRLETVLKPDWNPDPT